MWVHNASEETNAISQWPVILAVCVSLTVVMTTIVALRFYVRAIMLKAIGKDDWVILFSAVSLSSFLQNISQMLIKISLQICSIIYSGICIGRTLPMQPHMAIY
jgi:hypothetical protein